MIITRTPLRIGFFGGGTDLPEFYENYGRGYVLAAAINKYIYIAVNRKFDGAIRLSYSKTENVRDIEQIKHPLFREAMRHTGVTGGVEIVSVADVPGLGTGLGSSGAFLIGLLKALGEGYRENPRALVDSAAHIERNILKRSAGLQDYLSAVWGGLNVFRFEKECLRKLKPDQGYEPVNYTVLEKYIMLFYTGVSRKSEDVLKIQKKRIPDCVDALSLMREQVGRGMMILKLGDMERFGTLLNEAWALKKIISPCTIPLIDEAHQNAMKAGAWGGKVCGAGKGGFMMFVCPPENQESVRRALSPMIEMPFKFSRTGSTVIYAD